MTNRCTIVSPSGNLYGSEQVLFDFLVGTGEVYTVMVPAGSLLLRKLQEARLAHRLKTFRTGSPLRLYAGIFFQLAAGRIRTLYLNEAGHSRYAVMLARWYRKKNFVIHVRMKEDTEPGRWPSHPLPNLRLIAISGYIEHRLPLPAECILDPYRFTDRPLRAAKIDSSGLTIGVIGRITVTKGLYKLVQLAEHAAKDPAAARLRFALFGDVSGDSEDRELVGRLQALPNVKFEGFVSDKDAIYDNLDAVLHMSVVEALGRIFFEAIDYGKPFLGFDAAGIGEIARLTGLDRGLAAADGDWMDKLLQRLLLLDREYGQWAEEVRNKKEACRNIFSMDRYVSRINALIAS
ncbi:MAG TPA: glycosyltransferase [Puia sp.]|nr:glycosyltransferase [Puia sp.]